MNNQDLLSLNLQKYTEIIVKELHFQSYHFVELFIYFNNFIENEAIEQESFLTANTTLLNPDEEDEEGVESLSQEIFSVFSPTGQASITSLSCYLKKISLSTSSEFDVDVLFALLDKDNKGYIDYNDIDIIISSLEDFIDDDRGDWSTYEKAFSNKKIIKKNLLQNNFFDNVKKLFKKVNQLIQTRLENKRKEEEEREKETMNNHKDNNSSNVGVTIYKKKEAIPKLNLNSQANQYEYNTQSATSKVLPLDEMLFDRSKVNIVKRIRLSTYLYDITYDDFINELFSFESHSFTKQQFIEMICKIISKKTSDLLITPIMKMALSMFFQIIDTDKKNKVTFYETLGAIIPLTKNPNNYDKVKMLYKYPKATRYQILAGTFSLYLNTKMIKDLEIFSEIAFNTWDEAKVGCQNDLINWAFNFTQPINKNFIEYNPNPNVRVSYSPSEVVQLFGSLKKSFSSLRAGVMPEISQLPILEMTQRIIKYSFLGVINNYQLNTLLKTAIEDKYQDLPQKTKEKIKDVFLNTIEQNFAFTQNELIDITPLQTFCMLLFSGSTIEKFQSIFAIYDIEENEPIEYEDLYEYLTFLFGFVMKQNKTEWFEAQSLAKIICDYIVEKIDKKISLTCLMHVYESLVNN